MWEVKPNYKRQEMDTNCAICKWKKTRCCDATEHALHCQVERTTVQEGPGQKRIKGIITGKKKQRFLKEIKKQDLQYEEQDSKRKERTGNQLNQSVLVQKDKAGCKNRRS